MKKRLLPLLAVAALAAAGCGSSSHPNTNTAPGGTTAAPVSKATFIAQLNSLCMRANNAFSAAHNLQGEQAVVSHYVAMFASLQPPADLKALYAKYVTVLQKELAALKGGNANELYTLARTDARPLVEQIGAKGCVTSS